MLNRRQIRQAEELVSYKFKIYYRKESKNGKTDALNRRADYLAEKKKKSRIIFKIDNKKIFSCNIEFIVEITQYAKKSETKTIRDYHNNNSAGYKKVI